MSFKKKKIRKSNIIHVGFTKVPTCAVDRVGTVQNGCQLRIMAFDRAIMLNDSSDIGCRLMRLYYMAVNRHGGQQICMVYDRLGRQHR